MTGMATKPKRPRDTNQLAKHVVDIATGEVQREPEEKQRAISGRLGGLKGGVVRAERLSPQRRKAIAKKAALSRWKKSTEPVD